MWNGHFYLLITSGKANDYSYSWDEARDYCEQMGGHLAVINSEEEQGIISQLLSKQSNQEL